MKTGSKSTFSKYKDAIVIFSFPILMLAWAVSSYQ